VFDPTLIAMRRSLDLVDLTSRAGHVLLGG
jgi:hypothetical protein